MKTLHILIHQPDLASVFSPWFWPRDRTAHIWDEDLFTTYKVGPVPGMHLQGFLLQLPNYRVIYRVDNPLYNW